MNERRQDDDGKGAIGGTATTDEREQSQLPPRGEARQGEGTHGNKRRRPSTEGRPHSNVDTTRLP